MQKVSDLRLLINSSAYKRRLNTSDLIFPSINANEMIDNDPLNWLQLYLKNERHASYTTFIHALIEVVERTNNRNTNDGHINRKLNESAVSFLKCSHYYIIHN